jgi:hypothetical protein
LTWTWCRIYFFQNTVPLWDKALLQYPPPPKFGHLCYYSTVKQRSFENEDKASRFLDISVMTYRNVEFVSRSGHLTARERSSGTHWTEGCVAHVAWLNMAVKRKVDVPAEVGTSAVQLVIFWSVRFYYSKITFIDPFGNHGQNLRFYS